MLDAEWVAFYGTTKPARTWCKYAGGRGCAVHDCPRPPVCTEFSCWWQQDERLPEDWRPDKSGVLLAYQGRVTDSAGQVWYIIQVSEQYHGLIDKLRILNRLDGRFIWRVMYAHKNGCHYKCKSSDRVLIRQLIDSVTELAREYGHDAGGLVGELGTLYEYGII